LATAQLNLGIVALQRHRLDDATRLLEEALSGYRRGADRIGQARALTSIGNLHRVGGEYDLAMRTIEEGLHLRREQGDRQLKPFSALDRGKGLHCAELPRRPRPRCNSAPATLPGGTRPRTAPTSRPRPAC